MNILKQSTQVIVRIGPFVDVGNGFTPETGITLGSADEAELLKAGSVEVDISGRTWAAISGCDGWYDLTLTTSDTDTVGLLTVVVQDDSECLPVFRHFQVVEENVYDGIFAASGDLMTTIDSIETKVDTIDTTADWLKAVAEGDCYIDTGQTPWQLVVHKKGDDQTEYIRKNLFDENDANITDTDTVITQQLEPT